MKTGGNNQYTSLFRINPLQSTRDLHCPTYHRIQMRMDLVQALSSDGMFVQYAWLFGGLRCRWIGWWTRRFIRRVVWRKLTVWAGNKNVIRVHASKIGKDTTTFVCTDSTLIRVSAIKYPLPASSSIMMFMCATCIILLWTSRTEWYLSLPHTREAWWSTQISCPIRFRAIYGVRGSISLHQNLRKNARRASGSRFSLHQKLANSFRVGIASVNRAVMPDLLRIFCNIACLERLYNQPMVASPPSVTISTWWNIIGMTSLPRSVTVGTIVELGVAPMFVPDKSVTKGDLAEVRGFKTNLKKRVTLTHLNKTVKWLNLK